MYLQFNRKNVSAITLASVALLALSLVATKQSPFTLIFSALSSHTYPSARVRGSLVPLDLHARRNSSLQVTTTNNSSSPKHHSEDRNASYSQSPSKDEMEERLSKFELTVSPVDAPPAGGIKIWMMTGTSCNISHNHIRHFVSHYTDYLKIDPNNMRILLYGEVDNCSDALQFWQSLVGVQSVRISENPFSECNRMRDMLTERNHINMSDKDWWFNRDIDEFPVLPTLKDTTVSPFIQLIDSSPPGSNVFFSPLLDRTTRDGSLPHLDEEDFWEQLPLCCRHLTHVLKGKKGTVVPKMLLWHSKILPSNIGVHDVLSATSTTMPLANKNGKWQTCRNSSTIILSSYTNIPKHRHALPVRLSACDFPIYHLKYTSDYAHTVEEHLQHNWKTGYQAMKDLIEETKSQGEIKIPKEVLKQSRCFPCRRCTQVEG